MKTKQSGVSLPIELIAWVVGLGVLALYDPEAQAHFTLCPVANLGFEFCPGCGLGRSISWLFRGEISRSFQAHPLGIFAVIVLSFRTFQLTKNYFNPHGKSY